MIPFDFCFDATDPATGNLAAYYLKQGSGQGTAVLIDPLDTSFYGPPEGPINFGQNKFVVTMPRTGGGLPPIATKFWVSGDGGSTWATVAGGPVYNGVSANVNRVSRIFWDGSATVNIAFVQNDDSIAFVDFNLAKQTFSVAYGTVGGPSISANAGLVNLVRRSDGSLVVMYLRQVAGHARLFISVFSGGVWGVEQEISGNFGATKSIQMGYWFVLDPATQITHLFYRNVTDAILAYRQFSALNVLGAATTFAAVGPLSDQPVWGTPTITGNSLIAPINPVGAVNGFEVPGAYFGTPLSAPVWTLDRNVDPLADGELTPDVQPGPAFTFNGVTYMFWITTPAGGANFPEGRIFVALNTGVVGSWSARTLLFDVAASPLNAAVNQVVEDLGVMLRAGVLTLKFAGQKIYG